MIKYRKHKKTKIITNCRDWSAEVGDLFLDSNGTLSRLQESTGINKSRLGELTPRKINPPKENMIAVLIDGSIFWKEI